MPVHEPTVWANGIATEPQPIVIDWLSGVDLDPISHVVLTGDTMNRSAQPGQPVSRGAEVDLLTCSVHTQITGTNAQRRFLQTPY